MPRLSIQWSGYVCDSCPISEVIRKKDTVEMEATDPEAFPIERVFAQFETEEQAITFEQTLLAGEAMLVAPSSEDGDAPHIDEDYVVTDGLWRLAVMHDDGVSAWGFKKKIRILWKWTKAHNFDLNHCRIESW